MSFFRWGGIFEKSDPAAPYCPDMPEMTGTVVRRRFRFVGRVQNVGFRYECYMLAKQLRLVGWVENQGNGDVLAEVEGVEGRIALFIQGLRSIQRIRIDRLDTENLPVKNSERGFQMRY